MGPFVDTGLTLRLVRHMRRASRAQRGCIPMLPGGWDSQSPDIWVLATPHSGYSITRCPSDAGGTAHLTVPSGGTDSPKTCQRMQETEDKLLLN